MEGSLVPRYSSFQDSWCHPPLLALYILRSCKIGLPLGRVISSILGLVQPFSGPRLSPSSPCLSIRTHTYSPLHPKPYSIPCRLLFAYLGILHSTPQPQPGPGTPCHSWCSKEEDIS